MERIPLANGHLAADVDRKDTASWWLYLHGWSSDRKGGKATAFRAAAAEAGVSFAAIDARGHGESSGTLSDVTLSGLLEDLDATVTALVPPSARLVLAGSSLGGLAAAWWAATRPRKPDACVLIAPALRFMERFLAEIGPDRAAAWEREGVLRVEWQESPLRWSLAKDALSYEEGALARVYATDALILHGIEDERVPWRVSADFVDSCPHRPVDLVLLGDADHRLAEQSADLPRLACGFLRRRGLLA